MTLGSRWAASDAPSGFRGRFQPLPKDNLQSFHGVLTTQATERSTFKAMKPFRRIITLVWIVASFLANAGEPLVAKAKVAANEPSAEGVIREPRTWCGT